MRNALARFDRVDGVTDAERDRVFANIKKAAAHYGVEVTATTRRDGTAVAFPGWHQPPSGFLTGFIP